MLVFPTLVNMEGLVAMRRLPSLILIVIVRLSMRESTAKVSRPECLLTEILHFWSFLLEEIPNSIL